MIRTLAPTASAVLRELTRHGSATRHELQGALGASGPTIARSIQELDDIGIVEIRATTPLGKGRPAERIALAADGLCTIGVSIRAGETLVSLIDSTGRSRWRKILAIDESTDYRIALQLICDTVLAIARRASGSFQALAGVGVSFAGSANFEQGRITAPSTFQHWHQKPLAHDIEAVTSLPCAIDNYSIALVRALNWFDASAPSDFFLVVADYGIGGIASLNGTAYRGAGSVPRAFGHIDSRVTGDRACHCGSSTCLNATSSLRAIRDHARQRGWLKAAGGELAATVMFLDQAGPDTAELLANSAERLSERALDICRSFDLTVCFLGGLLFDCSQKARFSAESTFLRAFGGRCQPRFLKDVLAASNTDDMAAAAIAYDHLSARRQIKELQGHKKSSAALVHRDR